MRNFRRVCFLYLRVVFIALVFFPLSFFWTENGYTLDAKHLILAITGIQPYFNDEWWFLFPWAIICLISPLLFKILDWLGVVKTMFIFLVIDLASSLFIHTMGDVLFSLPGRYFYQVILVLRLSFPFLLGAVAAKTGLFTKVQSMHSKGKLLLYLCMAIVLLLRIFLLQYGVFNPFIALGICCVVVTFKLNRLLIGLGKRSTSMWLVHTFFCYYYFHDFFQYLKYPVLMYLVLIIYSYITASIVDFFYGKLQKVL